MKILLVAINAKYIHSNPAVYSLKNHLPKEHKVNTDIYEATINQPIEDIIYEIFRKKPDVVAFSVYIWNRSVTEKIIRELYKIMPALKVVLGGPEASFDAETFINLNDSVEAVMLGEGEDTFSELVDYYMSQPSKSLEDIKGLYTKKGMTGKRDELDFNKVSFIYEDLGSFENRIVYYESSRGCPFGCTYCLSSEDRITRYRDIDTVKRELAFFLDNKVSQVKFIDRTFNSNKERSLSIWQFIKDNDNGITNFHFEIAADIMTDEQIELLRSMRPGLVQLEIGVQSVNEVTLKEIHRYVDTSHIERVVERLRENENIHIHLDLIAGLPYEDYDSFVNSFNRVYNMNPHDLQLGFLKVLKGTAMERNATEYGLYSTDYPPYEVLSTKWISYEQIRILKRVEAVLEIYHNSLQFTNTMPKFVEYYKEPFKLYKALSDFYEKNNYFVITPARSRRYEILLEFADESGIDMELIRKLLTRDYYLRENPKNKPDFVKEIPEDIVKNNKNRSKVTGNFSD